MYLLSRRNRSFRVDPLVVELGATMEVGDCYERFRVKERESRQYFGENRFGIWEGNVWRGSKLGKSVRGENRFGIYVKNILLLNYHFITKLSI